MAEVLAELVAKITADATELKQGLGEADKSIQSWVKGNERQFKAVGAALTGVGVAITGSLVMMTKSAIEEEVNIKRLGVALKGVGVNYDDVKDSLEATILATQRKTGIADDQQRDVLGRLILVTKDYDKAISLLPLALDLAAAGQMDASTAATYLSKAYIELENGAEEIGIRIGQATVNFKNLDEVQKLVGGTAEATVNPFNVLKASIGDLAENIGSFLVPTLKSIIDIFVPIIERVQAWTSAHPELIKQLLILAGVIGGVALVLGPILIMLPMLVASFGLLLGPIGLVVAAIIGLIALGTLIVMNWDWIKEKAAEIWDAIANFFKNTWGKIVGFFKEHWDKILAILFPAIGLPILIARNWGTIKDYVRGLWDSVTGIIGAWWDNIKAFFARMNPWEWMKKGWEKISEGIGGILKGIFGGSDIENWVDGLTSYLGNVDLQAAGEKMFGTLKQGIKYKLAEVTDEVAAFVIAAGGVAPGLMPALQAKWNEVLALRGAGKWEEALAMEIGELAPLQKQVWGGQYGGIVTQPTLGLIGEAGPEAVIPLKEVGNMGGITINFTQPVFFDREDTLNKFVDMIRKGIQRQDRLRFGGAYAGQ